MTSGKVTFTRVLVIIMLVLLVLQFEFGMAINLGPGLPQLQPMPLDQQQFLGALGQAGGVALFHAYFGMLVGLMALLILIVSLISGVRGAQVFGVLGFITILLAAYSGLYFVLSGFQNDGLSHGMATNFMLSLIFYFLELYILKPLPRAPAA